VQFSELERPRDLDLGSGHTAYRRASVIDLYLHTKCDWNRKKLKNFLWTDGRTYWRTFQTPSLILLGRLEVDMMENNFGVLDTISCSSFYYRRSIAERRGCFQWLLFVSHDWTVSSEHIRFLFVSFFINLFCLVPCSRLIWLLVRFWAHVNIVHRIVSLNWAESIVFEWLDIHFVYGDLPPHGAMASCTTAHGFLVFRNICNCIKHRVASCHTAEVISIQVYLPQPIPQRDPLHVWYGRPHL